MVSTAWNSASPALKSARCAVVRPTSGVVKFSAPADMSACELVRHCANSRTKTPVAAINTNIVFRTLSLSDFIVTPFSHQVLRVPLRSHRPLSEQPRDFASPNFPDVFPVFCARLLLPAYSQIDTVAQSNPTTRGLWIFCTGL